MRILADENMPAVNELFGDLGADIRTLPGRTLQPADVAAADVLLVRSVTRVDSDLLADASLQFVGSATIGTDHIDQALLSRNGIPFAYAPGCNADAVGDYVIAALCSLFESEPERLADSTLAIIGAGNVGGRLAARLRRMGLSVRVCDPPRQQREAGEGEGGEAFCSLAEAMASDIVCCHTPLVDDGPHPTKGMITETLLDHLPENAVFLNAGRGGILSADTLARVQVHRPDIQWVLDVWDPEPNIPLSLLPGVSLATGHIAGYSAEGRVRGTWMLRQALARALDRPLTDAHPLSLLPPAPDIAIPAAYCGAGVADPWQTLFYAVRQVYDLSRDDRRFREAMAASDHGQAFDRYRRTYPQRRELMSTRVTGDETRLTTDQRDLLAGAGFLTA